MTTAAQPPQNDTPAPAPEPAATGICLRCHQERPIVEDGFCADCLRTMEDACL